MKVCVLIPVLNESMAVGKIVEDLRKLSLDVVVVDDGSTDGSGEIAQKKGAFVIRHSQRRGKGQSLQDGFEYVLKQNYDCVVTMDGDGQHDANDLTGFIKKAKAYPRSIVTGNRMSNSQGMPFIRLMTNRFMSGLISLVCKQRIPDTQCGYRLINCEILKAIKISSSDYEIETEVLIKAAKKGFPIYSVPIKTIYRNEKSNVHPIIDSIRFLKYFMKEMWTSKP